MPFLILGFSIQMHPLIVLYLYRKHKQSKKREYSEYVHEVEHGVFTPLVLSSLGGMAHEASIFYKHLAELVSRKCKESYMV